MKNIFEIKEEYKSTIVGFNNSGLPLGSRSDLDKLALMAYVNPGLAKYFVSLPSKEQISEYRADRMLGIGDQAATDEEAVTPDSTIGPAIEETIQPEEEPVVIEEQKTVKPGRSNRPRKDENR